eukprot:c24018_g1_i1 orf=60-7133(+)
MALSSSKWRALQRRHKWSYDAVRLPPSRLQTLLLLQQQLHQRAPLLSNFLAALLDMLQLTSTHAQLSALKKVISSFQDLLHHQETRPSCVGEIPCRASDVGNVPACVGADVDNDVILSVCAGADVDNDEPHIPCVRADVDTHAVYVDADVGDEATLGMPLYLLVEILFLDNSVPLHRSILSCLGGLPTKWKEPIKKALAQCIQEYGIAGPKTRRFSLAGVASTLFNLPKPGLLKGILETFAATITDTLSYGVQCLLLEAREGGRPTPTAMEECQGALSCLYYMFQLYSHELFTPCTRPFTLNSEGIEDGNSAAEDRNSTVYIAGLDVILDVLQTGYLSRDCCIAAGVGLCAAMQVETDHSVLACMLASSLFAATEKGLAILTKEGLKYGLQAVTPIEAAIYQIRGTDLASEVSRFTEFGRLCVLRGLLTAVPRTSLNMNFLYKGKYAGEAGHVRQEDTFLGWSVLFDGTLPALCDLCESSVDSHFKFHSVTALQICLQQIKTSISLGLTFSAFQELEDKARDYGYNILPYCPVSNAAVQRILQIVWNNWEDPLNQTVKQIQVAFDLLVDIKCLVLDKMVVSSSRDESQEAKSHKNGDQVKEFLYGILRELLTAGGHRKGRYVPLASLSSRLGALNLLKISPNLLFESVNAMADDDVCCSAGSFLKAFLERLREDCWSTEKGVMEGIAAFRRLSLPPIIAGMVSGNSRLRVNINTYALPVALQIDSDAILPLLAFALDGTVSDKEEKVSWHEIEGAFGLPEHLTTNQRVALMIGLLKTARMEALIEGDLCCATDYASDRQEFKYSSDGMASVSVKRNVFTIPLVLLEIAVTHSEDSLRIDAAEALCLNPKTASMPSYLELALLKVSIPLNLRCSSTSFRMKWTSLFRKFFLRIRISIERQLKADASRVKAKKSGKAETLLEDDEPTCSMPVNVEQMQSFMRWFCNILLFSLYPSAPYERKTMSMELIAAMLESWSLTNASLYSIGTNSFLTVDATTVLLGSIVDSWDKLREGAFRILSSYPTPLPGYKSTFEVEKILKWAMSLVNSPRVRESDAGALVLRLVFQKYVVQLGWILKLHPQPLAMCPKLSDNERGPPNVGVAVAKFVESLNDWLEWGIVEGEQNLLKACRHSFVHGALLSYRYTIEELDWKSNSLIAAASDLRKALARLLSLLTRVTAIALWVVSADAFDLSQGLNVSSKPSNIELEGLFEDDDKVAMNDWDDVACEQAGDEEMGFLAPSEQAIMVGCWLAMKEVSLLLGTVTRKVPLPGCDSPDLEDSEISLSLLDLNQLELIGGHFLQVLLSMKHNGAIDKTRAGFVALCNRLLCSSDARLNKMPEFWLQQLMDRTAAKGQIVDDLLRRSAGIPAAFLALFLAEPEGAPKKLLLIAMRWLIDLVKSFLEGSHADGITVQADMTKGSATSSLLLKKRDEGVVPTVHAFNVMRVTFNDTNLSTDSSGFCAEGLSVAIQAFSSHYWEVRNAAVLAFTALLRRMVGFLNNETYESARRAITGFEFFHRFPLLHSFLLKELQNATSQLEDEKGCETAIKSGNLSRTLHPSLAPILIILSRLKPSIINSDADDWLSPSTFIPYISRCATQSNLKVRILASRALAPLVVADNLPCTLQELAKCLPMQRDVALQRIEEQMESFDTSSPRKDTESVQCSSSRRLLPFNTIHGVLLQMHSLLTYNCVTLPSNSGLRKEILSLLLPIMNGVDKVFLFRCPTVGAAFLEVLQSLMSVHSMCIPRSSPDATQELLFQASAAVLDGVYDTPCHKVPWDSTRVTLKVKACKRYFEEILMGWLSDAVNDSELNCIPCQDNGAQQWRTDGKEFLTRLKDCLFNSMYEVRLGVLKALKGIFDLLELKFNMQDSIKLSIQRIEWAAGTIHPLLIECLRAETHPRCIRYALLNYFTLSMLQLKIQKSLVECDATTINPIEDGSAATAFEMWPLFVKVYQSTKHVKTKEVAVCCLGLCIQQTTQCLGKFSTLQTSSCLFCQQFPDICNFVKESMQFWLDLIQKHSAASEPVMLRRATADAIVASGLLKQVEWVGVRLGSSCIQPSSHNAPEKEKSQHMRGCMGEEQVVRTVLDVWFVCLKLLEDEDMVLREKLAVAVLHIVSPVYDKQLVCGAADFVPAQVERVIHLSFNFLSFHLSHSVAYIDYLANWVWRGLADMNTIQDDCNLVRRLFDKEADNHHEEGLLFTQLCFLHIRKILDDMQGEPMNLSSGNHNRSLSLSEILQSWRERFLIHLRSYVEKFLILEDRLQWLGGLTNHPDVFRTWYPLLLGLLIFSSPAEVAFDSSESSEEDKISIGVVEVIEKMKASVANPLILNILTRIMRQYDAHNFSLLGVQKDLLMENFDPFFLLY